MIFEKRLTAFKQLGIVLHEYLSGKDNQLLESAIVKAEFHNPWFIKNFVFTMLQSITSMLQEKSLEEWTNKYPAIKNVTRNKRIGLLLAGNIPLVGFHDILSVLLSGNTIVGKLSSKDEILTTAIIEMVLEIEPAFQEHIQLTHKNIENVDAIIATGSNNTARYFNHYFGKYPNIIRKNRNSLAVLNGKESKEELMKLADDIFLYFGLGCRNISKIFIPEDFDMNKLTEAFTNYHYITMNNKYLNNLNYYKSIYIMNNVDYIDGGNILLKEDYSLHSPIANLHFQKYDDLKEIDKYIENEKDTIQCIATNMNFDFDTVKPGQTQFPELWDYSDNIDTLAFLLNL